MKELFKKVPVKAATILVTGALIYCAIVISIALARGASIKLLGIEISWNAQVASLNDKIASVQKKLSVEQQLSADARSRSDALSNDNAETTQNFKNCVQRYSDQQNLLEQAKNIVEEKDARIKQLQDNNNILNRTSILINNIKTKEEQLSNHLDELKGINSEYESLQAQCTSQGESFYFHPCVKAGEKKGMVDSLINKIHVFERELAEDRALANKLTDKLRPI